VNIHPTAIIDERAELGTDVEVGPFAIVGPDVSVGSRCRIGPHANLQGPLELGTECVVGHAATIGHDPQVKDNPGPFGRTRIGARNVFREFSQVHRSMKPDGETVIGNDCFFMVAAHIAHDCVVGDNVVICNNTMLGGHVHVHDRAYISAICGVHQFTRIGTLSMVGGNTSVPRDVPPYGMVIGTRPTRLEGLNTVGIRRAGLEPDARRALRAAFRSLFRSELPLGERLAAVGRLTPEVELLVKFIVESERGVIGFGGRVDR